MSGVTWGGQLQLAPWNETRVIMIPVCMGQGRLSACEMFLSGVSTLLFLRPDPCHATDTTFCAAERSEYAYGYIRSCVPTHCSDAHQIARPLNEAVPTIVVEEVPS